MRELLRSRYVRPMAILSILVTTTITVLVIAGSFILFEHLIGADSVSLAISDITVSETTETEATISWTTDEPIASRVVYGESPWGLENTLLDGELTTEHEVTLIGLDPDTLYYYKIECSDNLSDETEGAEEGEEAEAESDIEAFTTLPSDDTVAPLISEVEVSGITHQSAIISWATDEPATGQVEFGDSDSYGQTSELVEDLDTEHRIVIEGLDLGTTYRFAVRSSDAAGNETLYESEEQILTTSTSIDTVAPLVSGLDVSVTETSATITWTTDEPTTCQVEYGDSDSYGQASDLVEEFDTKHSIVLEDLELGATYHFAIKSSDASGNEYVSADKTFIPSTPADTVPPVISGFHISNNYNGTVTISWITDEQASSKVYYYCDTWGLIPPVTLQDGELVKTHSLTGNITSGKSYSYRITSVDDSGNVATTTGHFKVWSITVGARLYSGDKRSVSHLTFS